MFHTILDGTNQLKYGSQGNKENHILQSITDIFKAKTLGRLYTVHQK